MLTQDPLAVVEGRPYGRGLIIGVAAGLGCALIVLGIDMAESIDSARHSVVPFLVALPLALLPVPLLIALVLLLDRLEPEPPGNLIFCFAWGAGLFHWMIVVGQTNYTEPTGVWTDYTTARWTNGIYYSREDIAHSIP